MRKRRRSFAPKLLFLLGVLLLLVAAAIALPSLTRHGFVAPEWQKQLDYLLDTVRQVIPGEEQLAYLKWLGGLLLALGGAAGTLLVSWHFAEINLPQRIEDWKKAHAKDHLSLQPQFLAMARKGLGAIPPDIETSRLTLLRKWLSGWSKKEQARVLAASVNQVAREATALAAATLDAQQEQITAHLIRGYQHVSASDEEAAFEEFQAAARVRSDNILSRDIAAGCARRLKNQKKETELLEQMQIIASDGGFDIDQARALRRRAELLDKHDNEVDRVKARNLLNSAIALLNPLGGDLQINLELGRALTLFCEVQCNRTVIGHLDGPLARMLHFMQHVPMNTRPEEHDGEAYGEKRALLVQRRVAALRDDVVATDTEEDRS